MRSLLLVMITLAAMVALGAVDGACGGSSTPGTGGAPGTGGTTGGGTGGTTGGGTGGATGSSGGATGSSGGATGSGGVGITSGINSACQGCAAVNCFAQIATCANDTACSACVMTNYAPCMGGGNAAYTAVCACAAGPCAACNAYCQ